MAEQDGENLTMEHIISVVLKELKFGSIKDEMWLSKAGETS
ncbi:hypothetical protein BWQ95_19915 [Aeromonas hydrophila]|uniref:Uncharacterized protein n=2 Tax=Aeromonas hydrophila TaxID=644 RepID=A0KGN5_AERHH|nr:hypothetical protein AHA_0888 [Aeromonas hydrophila subsp. hydrophila ATCC 7966]AUZ76463.1 hypothetical protein C2U40_17520 [Aeromonas sp. ASNIH4]AZU47241.1 hypothetical protein C3B79_1463 [Aeromonas hydrophila]POV86409.1 hypothetical protein C3395_19960 [Aeromonas sp. ASNIH6]MBW3796491.1 hypothetical protein [Aeromonas hydrophila]